MASEVVAETSKDSDEMVLRIGLFVDILEKEFEVHKGYKTKDWRNLLKYWRDNIANLEFWTAMKEQAQVMNRGKSLPYETVVEREKTIGWLQSLDSKDIEYTLYQYFEGGLFQKREEILKKRNRPSSSKAPPMPHTDNPRVLDMSIAKLIFNLFEKQKGYSPRNIETLMKFFKEVRVKVELLVNLPEESVQLTLSAFMEAKSKLEKEKHQQHITSSFAKKKQEKKKLLNRNIANLSQAPPAIPKSLESLYKEIQSVFKLLKNYYQENQNYTNDPDTLFGFYKNLDSEVKKLYDLPEDAEETRIRINKFFSREIIVARILGLFKSCFGYYTENINSLYKYWVTISTPDKYLAGVHYSDKEELYSLLTSYFENLENERKEQQKREEEEQQEHNLRKKMKYEKLERPPLYEVKQNRLKLGKKLVELGKKFPLDPVLKRMIKIELAHNAKVRYNLEYETANRTEELARKSRLRNLTVSKSKDPRTQEQLMREHWEKLKFKEKQEQQKTQAEQATLKSQEKGMFKQALEIARQYLSKRSSQHVSLTSHLGASYASLKAQFPLAVNKHFPFQNYGSVKTKKGKTFEKAYPVSWKHYFFGLVRSFLHTPDGLQFLKLMHCNFWMPPSASVCTIHKTDCPKNCPYVSLNQKAVKQTQKHQKSELQWHEKIRPWRREDMLSHKQQVFMSFSDAKECTFEPIIGSKLPKKQVDLALKTFTELRNIYEPDKPPNFEMWATRRRGEKKESRDPYIKKSGKYKKARAFFYQGYPEKALQILEKKFNIPCILEKYTGEKQPNVNEKPLEDFEKPISSELLENVFLLYKAIKDQKEAVDKQIKRLEKEYQAESKGNYKIRTEMCPVGDNCKKYQEKDPQNPKDHNCPFAHKRTELRFSKEQKSRKKAQEHSIQSLKKTKEETPNPIPWRHDGYITECSRCYSNFLYKPLVSSTALGATAKDMQSWNRNTSCFCNRCAIEAKKKVNQSVILQRGHKLNEEVYYKKLDPNRNKREQLFSKKLGLYRKAKVLSNDRRYVAALETLTKAFELINQEKHLKKLSKKNDLRSKSVKGSLGFDKKETSLAEDSQKSLKMVVGSGLGVLGLMQKYSKEYLPKAQEYQEKTKSGHQEDSNDFLNEQILELYEQIGKIKAKEKHYAENLKKTAETLEDGNQDLSKSYLLKPPKTQMCPYIIKKENCPDGKECEYAHYSIELDLVPKSELAYNLKRTSMTIQKKSLNDERLPDWKPWHK